MISVDVGSVNMGASVASRARSSLDGIDDAAARLDGDDEIDCVDLAADFDSGLLSRFSDILLNRASHTHTPHD
jgi:hypothetical protein